jgi:hypothetical protein
MSLALMHFWSNDVAAYDVCLGVFNLFRMINYYLDRLRLLGHLRNDFSFKGSFYPAAMANREKRAAIHFFNSCRLKLHISFQHSISHTHTHTHARS